VTLKNQKMQKTFYPNLLQRSGEKIEEVGRSWGHDIMLISTSLTSRVRDGGSGTLFGETSFTEVVSGGQ